MFFFCFFFSSRRRHTRLVSDWSSDVCSSDLQDWSKNRRKFRPAMKWWPQSVSPTVFLTPERNTKGPEKRATQPKGKTSFVHASWRADREPERTGPDRSTWLRALPRPHSRTSNTG